MTFRNGKRIRERVDHDREPPGQKIRAKAVPGDPTLFSKCNPESFVRQQNHRLRQLVRDMLLDENLNLPANYRRKIEREITQ